MAGRAVAAAEKKFERGARHNMLLWCVIVSGLCNLKRDTAFAIWL